MKSDIKGKELAAELLRKRMQEKVEQESVMSDEDERKEAESDCLYYWILSRLYAKSEGRRPASPHAVIEVKGQMNNYNKVVLSQGKLADYLPYYVEGEEFYQVIQDTLKIFSELDGFSASYFYSDSGEYCEFAVYASALNKKR